MLHVGEFIGRYQIVEELVGGGMAKVYKAFDTRLERNVAIKVILPSEQSSPEFLKRFEREAKALAHLSHPNIVKVLDFGDQDGAPYLVMEYIGGGTLKDRLGVAMTYQQAAAILAPIARALESAHREGIIHRDVKPANILLTESGLPMLSDFGIAKIVTGQQTQTELTGTGVGLGTPFYMAPEQGLGNPVDGRADTYALGVVLFELVTGRKPFDSDTPMAVVIKHATEAPPRPRDLMPSLPEMVENVILCALAKNPNDRFQTIGDFAAALEQLSRSDGGKAAGRGKSAIVFPAPPKPVRTAAPSAATIAMQPGASGRATRAGRAAGGVLRWVLQLVGSLILVLIVVAALLLVGLSVALSSIIRNSISNAEFQDPSVTRTETYTEAELNTLVYDAVEPFAADYITSADVDFQPPDKVDMLFGTNTGVLQLEARVIEKNGKPPRFILKSINKIPLILIGGIISNGINSGLADAMENAGVTFSDVTITDRQISYIVSPAKP